MGREIFSFPRAGIFRDFLHYLQLIQTGPGIFSPKPVFFELFWSIYRAQGSSLVKGRSHSSLLKTMFRAFSHSTLDMANDGLKLVGRFFLFRKPVFFAVFRVFAVCPGGLGGKNFFLSLELIFFRYFLHFAVYQGRFL